MITPVFVLLLQLLVVIAVARGAGLVFRRFGQSAVIGEMAAGVVLGPSFLGQWFPSAEAFLFPPLSLPLLQLLSQLGVILYMFVVGMDVDLPRLRGRARSTILISNAGIVVPFVLGLALSPYLYERFAPAGVPFVAFAFFTAVAMSVTAFPVLARIISERRLTGTALGNMALGCAAIADVTAWCLLAVVLAVARGGGAVRPLLTVLLAAVFSVLVLKAIGPRIAARLTERHGRALTDRAILTWALVFAFASALATETIGIHAIFGAFVAGVSLSSARAVKVSVSAAIEPLAGVLLLPLFFASSGLRTEIGTLVGARDWLICLGVIAVAVAGKFGGSAAAARWSGLPWRDALSIGALMNTRGLMELIVLNVGYDLGVLSSAMYTMLVVMALVTTGMTGPMLAAIERSVGQPSSFADAAP